MMPSRSFVTRSPNEAGVIIVTFAMMLLFLIGFAAIAVDLGHLFVVRTELQTALDSCALAAAQELDGQTTSITRAVNAGLTAGNLNSVNLQSRDWDGESKLTAADITFRKSDYVETTAGVAAHYVQCRHTQSNVKTWLLQTISAFSPTTMPTRFAVLGNAVATRANAQTSCPLPLALRPLSASGPGYGFNKGDWVTLVDAQPGKDGGIAPGPGEIGWQVLDSTGASPNSGNTLKAEMDEPGYCGTKIGDNLPPPVQGVKQVVDQIWDYRFGVYKNKNDLPPQTHPDFTGYAYTTRPAGGAFSDFLSKRTAFAPYQNPDFNEIATSSQLAQYGYNRRVAPVPIIVGSTVVDFACMLMLAPRSLTGTPTISQLEYIGNASESNSPCTTNGLAGGTAGPLVPVLVR
jgi:Flp pilus assembly protein TadG